MVENNGIPHLKRLSDGKEYPLLADTMVIGRRDTCELVLGDESGVSRQHATISIQDGDVIIEDMGSTNGVLINGVKISSSTKINNEDKLIFDIFEYQLKMPQTDVFDDDKTVFHNRVVGGSVENQQPILESVAEVAPVIALKVEKDKPKESAAQPQKETPVEEPSEPQKRKAAWVEERNAGATMFMPAADGAADTGEIAPVDYKGTEPALIVIEGGDIGRTVELSLDKSKWSVGSAMSQDIVLSEEGVSESHATITRDGKKWELRDLLSQNGIRVNGNKTLHSFLSNEDVIKFGPVKCLFVIPAGYKNAPKPTAAKSGNQLFLKLFSVLALLIIAALAAANYFDVIDLKGMLTVNKGP